MKQVALEGFLKKHRDVSRTIATAKIATAKLCGISCYLHALTNFTKNTNITAMGVLNVPLEYYNIF